MLIEPWKKEDQSNRDGILIKHGGVSQKVR